MAAPGIYDTSVYDTATYDSFTVGAPTVELLLNGVWTDVTAYVRVDAGITIQRGQADWQSRPQPASCRLTFDNTTGRFTPRYASGAYYPYLVRNTQLRVSVRLDDGTNWVRFWGQVPTWPLQHDLSGNDFTVQVEAFGIRRRLTVGAIPLASPYTTFMTVQPTVLAYWPMEDGSTATTFASALSGGAVALQSGASPASDTSFAASQALPTFPTAASFRAVIPNHTPSVLGEQVRFLMKAGGTSAGNWVVQIDTSGAHYFWINFVPSTPAYQVLMFNYSTGVLEASGAAIVSTAAYTTGQRWSFDALQSGSNIVVTVNRLVPGATVGFFNADTFTSSTLGRITGVRLFAPTQLPDGTPVVASPDTITFGQLSMENTISSMFDSGAALTAYAGETANARWARFNAAPYSLPMDSVGTANQTMGAQGEMTPLEILDEAVEADGGISTEGIREFALRFRTTQSMMDQTPKSFNYARMNALVPVDDDQSLVNDVTVSRPNGSSARAVATAGLTPTAVGTYADSFDLNVYDDTTLADQAGWRATVGSQDQPRWPTVGFDALRLLSAERTSLVNMVEGDTLDLVSTPVVLGGGGPAGHKYVQVRGWTETINYATWDLVLNCIPAEPWNQVLVLDDTSYGILDTDRLGI